MYLLIKTLKPRQQQRKQRGSKIAWSKHTCGEGQCINIQQPRLWPRARPHVGQTSYPPFPSNHYFLCSHFHDFLSEMEMVSRAWKTRGLPPPQLLELCSLSPCHRERWQSTQARARERSAEWKWLLFAYKEISASTVAGECTSPFLLASVQVTVQAPLWKWWIIEFIHGV